MVIYEFKLNKDGDMTVIPDSHRIFGFLMNNAKKYYNNPEISGYTKDILSRKDNCMVSSLMPTGYYPFPIEYVKDELNIKEEMYKKIKKFSFIKKEALLNLLKKNVELKIENFNEAQFLKIEHKFIQKFRMESQIRKLPGFPNVAYSLDIITLVKGEKEQKDFSFFVKTEKNSLLQKFIEKMKKDIKNGEIFSYLGAKASSGLNTFSVYDINEIENKSGSKDSKFYINLGMLLPEFSKISSEDSFISLHTSDRKPYDIENNVDKAICFISPGSIIAKKDEAKDEFELVKSIHNNYNLLYKDAIIFGNSYLEELEV